jgi:hypothetical protein
MVRLTHGDGSWILNLARRIVAMGRWAASLPCGSKHPMTFADARAATSTPLLPPLDLVSAPD